MKELGCNEIINLETYCIKIQISLSKPVCHSLKLRNLISETNKSRMKSENDKKLKVPILKIPFRLLSTFLYYGYY